MGVNNISSHTAYHLSKSLNKLIKLYGQGSFVIHVLMMDMEFEKVVGNLGGGRRQHFSSARTRGRGRNCYQDGQVTRHGNLEHIIILFFTVLYQHSHGLLCDNAVEHTNRKKYNLNKVLSEGNSYWVAYGLQKSLYGSDWVRCGGAKRSDSKNQHEPNKILVN